ncbi:hypothetical protein BaRGS_00039218 [Batillaria attramentaria]|uniref:Uncharacterized protein n=1 Tax=Batillaria attramentaria TaxID=370345 RepID=A0ABD0J4E8_9CAEN
MPEDGSFAIMDKTCRHCVQCTARGNSWRSASTTMQLNLQAAPYSGRFMNREMSEDGPFTTTGKTCRHYGALLAATVDASHHNAIEPPSRSL